jgi:hypothetical protein
MTLREPVGSRMSPPFPQANGMNFLKRISRSPAFMPNPFTPGTFVAIASAAARSSAQVAGGVAGSSPARRRRSSFT